MTGVPLQTDVRGQGWQAPAASLLFVGTVLGAAWQWEGMLAVQRIMVDLVMPIGMTWMISFFIAVKYWKQQRYRGSSIAAILFLMISVLFSPIVSRQLFRLMEAPAPSISPLDPSGEKYRAVVVLGGGSSLGSDGTPQLNGDGHRVAMAAQMWQANRTGAIICTGSDNFVPEQDATNPRPITDSDLWNPARQGVDLLISLGVPKDRLFRIEGTHTAAEMKSLVKFLKQPPEGFPTDGPIGLTTSAFHLPRAMRLANREGLDLVPIPVSYRTGPDEPFSVGDFVPNANAGAQFAMFARECLARVVGR